VCRNKAALPSGWKAHPANALAGSAQIKRGWERSSPAIPRDRLAQFYTPGRPLNAEAELRKDRFAKLNAFITARNGDVEIVFETLPDSSVAEQLIAAGYDVRPADPPQTERILSSAIVESFTLSSAARSNSRLRIRRRSHAGICKVRRTSFSMA
jgi:hypothetical protein